MNELLRLTGDVVNFVIRFKVDFSIAEAVTLLGDDEGDVDFLSKQIGKHKVSNVPLFFQHHQLTLDWHEL